MDGGARSNRFLMQFQVDILEQKVFVSNVPELLSIGSVYLARLAVGVWGSIDDITKLNQTNDLYHPILEKDLRKEYYQGWKQSVDSILVK